MYSNKNNAIDVSLSVSLKNENLVNVTFFSDAVDGSLNIFADNIERGRIYKDRKLYETNPTYHNLIKRIEALVNEADSIYELHESLKELEGEIIINIVH